MTTTSVNLHCSGRERFNLDHLSSLTVANHNTTKSFVICQVAKMNQMFSYKR